MSALSVLKPFDALTSLAGKAAEKVLDSMGLPEIVGDLAKVGIAWHTGNLQLLRDGVEDAAKNVTAFLSPKELTQDLDLGEDEPTWPPIRLGSPVAHGTESGVSGQSAIENPGPLTKTAAAARKGAADSTEEPTSPAATKKKRSNSTSNAEKADSASKTEKADSTSKTEKADSASKTGKSRSATDAAESEPARKSERAGGKEKSGQSEPASGTNGSKDAARAFLDRHSDPEAFLAAVRKGLPPEVEQSQSAMLAVQQRMQEIQRMFQLMTQLLQAMHEMQVSIIRNIRA